MTLDLPQELQEAVLAEAAARGESWAETVTQLLQGALGLSS
jgi:hypothetical protein